ncbi:hypothetical protein [Dictyobacter kobayashii]|uniref:Uncharacterized protein n=1 Tax=Dictyobacter kobayashii TaxID=2014872 RepID=A0A402AR21_9CHLR|nr:hypothetical protein [Dictyobacter kobayashii]GCE21523.1 hypothetical protein KDK_53230 [Dictyobacter kobayashii]
MATPDDNGPALEYCLHSPNNQPALKEIQHIQVAARPIFTPTPHLKDVHSLDEH